MENWITTKIVLNTNKEEVFQFQFRTFTTDSNDNILEESEYDEDTNLVNRKIYSFYENGQVKEYIEYDPLENLIERHKHIRNELDEVYKIEFEYADGHKSIKEFFYTDLGNADKAVIRDEKGEITGYEIYVFDDLGNVKEEIELDSDQNEVMKYERTYLPNGKIKIQKQFRDGVLYSKESFRYDVNDREIEKIFKHTDDNNTVIDQYQYDERGNMIYACSHQNGVLFFENKCKYSIDNRLIEEEFFELDYWQKKIIRHERLVNELVK